MITEKIPIAISSSDKPKYAERRQKIRETWLKDLNTDRYYPLFLVNSKERAEGNEYLYCSEEQTLYVNCEDHYAYTSNKLRCYYSWALAETAASHFWKCDDDTYINTTKFNSYTAFLSYDYLGCLLNITDKEGVFKGLYRQFMSGAGHSVSRKAASVVLRFLPHIGLDDWVQGSIIMDKMPDALWYNEQSIDPFSGCKRIDGLMIGHYVFPEDMETMHNYYKDGN
jgi:hypothetical protein